MKTIAIILAGGSGQRLGNPTPKQFLYLGGKQVIEHSIEIFNNHPLVDEITIVSNLLYMNDVEALCLKNNYSKVKKILAGGKERYESSLSAIQSYSEDCYILIHDSVRPLVSSRIITECIQALKQYNAVNVGADVSDTIMQINDKNEIKNIPTRNELRFGQSPQAFKLSTINKAYEIGLKDENFNATDDCGVVLKYLPEEPIYVVKGDQYNMKITFDVDLITLENLLKSKKSSDAK